MSEINIKELRTKLKLTQEGLAHLIGVSFCTLSRWENNKSKPSPMAIKILRNLHQEIRIDDESTKH